LPFFYLSYSSYLYQFLTARAAQVYTAKALLDAVGAATGFVVLGVPPPPPPRPPGSPYRSPNPPPAGAFIAPQEMMRM